MIMVIIGFPHRVNENIDLKSMSNMYIIEYIFTCIAK